MKNILTIDLEDWFHGNYMDKKIDYNNITRRIENNAIQILRILRQGNNKATFFVLGDVAQNHPDLIREIYKEGHEIACHSYSHNLIYNMREEEFREDTKKAKFIIEEVISDKIIGYRAPSWSITKKSLWAWNILQEYGFMYSSSVFPVENYLYGIKDFERFRTKPKYNGHELNIYEIPSSTIRLLGKNIPFAGGFYFRTLPLFLIRNFIKQINNEGYPAIIYLHPWEIDDNLPKMKLSLKENFIRNYNVGACKGKFIKLLKNVNTRSIRDYYEF